jgi:AcrR family transcriptional regulator
MEVRKNKVIQSALKIFAEKGFQNTTITEISNHSKVSEASIYEYFGTKEELFFALPEKFSSDSIENTNKILPYIHTAEERIRFLVRRYTELYQNVPDYSAIILLQLMTNKKFRKTRADKLIRLAARQLLNCIREGINDGTFKSHLNPYLVRSMLLGTIEHMFIDWHLKEKPERTNILSMMDHFMDIVFTGIRREKEDTFIKIELKDMQKIKKLFQCETPDLE